MKERQQIAARLKAAREYLGLSQQEVADAVHLPRSAISLVETGQRGVEAVELKAFAKVYKRPVTHFTGEDKAELQPRDVEILTKKAAKLSVEDRETLLRYTDFLLQQAESKSE
jgi:transcriptional regulator with XRE-family HTH domain